MNNDGNNIINVSKIREMIKGGNLAYIKNMVAECTYKLFNSEKEIILLKKYKKWIWILLSFIKIYFFFFI